MSIEAHIIENFKNDSTESIKEAIISSVQEQDEVVLPGLGVFFRLLWQELEEGEQEKIVQNIRKGLDKTK